ncbi:unnamed protein product [Clavelina lepadiformis]|uniref:Uncharacterized protein n=1 Tax=Clavelina lepadiformis TaxID=159417 RepID=A0ABP0GEL4_CLALP
MLMVDEIGSVNSPFLGRLHVARQETVVCFLTVSFIVMSNVFKTLAAVCRVAVSLLTQQYLLVWDLLLAFKCQVDHVAVRSLMHHKPRKDCATRWCEFRI